MLSGPISFGPRQVLGIAGVAVCSGAFAASSSASRLHHRLIELATLRLRSWTGFWELIREIENFDAAASDT